jgi:TIR domain-containing protein
MESVLHIGNKTYYKTSNSVFEVTYKGLKDTRFIDLPCYSTIDVKNLPGKKSSFQLNISITHSGGESNEHFFIHFHISFFQRIDESNSTTNALLSHRKLLRISKLFKDLVDSGVIDEGMENRTQWDNKFYISVLYAKNFTKAENPVLREAIMPVVDRFNVLLKTRDLLLFMCHASEDKPFVDDLALAIDGKGLDIWYDKREIRVGESIVERISEGLGKATHLLVVLSKSSASKPWVKKELSSSLMRQLSSNSIKVIPLLREDCTIPTLLSDIKYANFRQDFKHGLHEMLEGILTG